MLRRRASESHGEIRKMIDLLPRVPGNALDILSMFHEDPHALKVSVRLDWLVGEQRGRRKT